MPGPNEVIEYCLGCDHPKAVHFKNVLEDVRCLHEDRGISDKGVMGIPWHLRCDCINGVSIRTDRVRKREKEEEERLSKATDALSEMIKNARSKSARPPG